MLNVKLNFIVTICNHNLKQNKIKKDTNRYNLNLKYIYYHLKNCVIFFYCKIISFIFLLYQIEMDKINYLLNFNKSSLLSLRQLINDVKVNYHS